MHFLVYVSNYILILIDRSSQHRVLASLPSSLLEVHITEVSVRKGVVKPYILEDGCPSSTGASVTKYFAVVKYNILNSGDDNFEPPSGYVGQADCQKPAIFKFLSLEGLIPSKQLSKYATCVVDDELAGQDACIYAQSPGMIIRKGKSYGLATEVYVKFGGRQSA